MDGIPEDELVLPRGYEGWIAQTDDWLLEAWRKEDQPERNIAATIVEARYRKELTDYVRRKLPEDWVEDTVQDVWVEFWAYLKTHETRVGLPQLLIGGIGHNVRVDAVKKLVRERQIEAGILTEKAPNTFQLARLADEIQELRSLEIAKQRVAFLRELPREERLLSDCQWVMWKLCKNFLFPSPEVARLMGKSTGVVYSSVSAAKQRLQGHIRAQDFSYVSENGTTARSREVGGSDVGSGPIFDWFSAPLLPQLTPEELKPLSLTHEELHAEYHVSLWVPNSVLKSAPDDPADEPATLLLTPRKHLNEMQFTLEALHKNRGRIRERDSRKYHHAIELFRGASSYGFSIGIDGDSIRLTSRGALRIEYFPGLVLYHESVYVEPIPDPYGLALFPRQSGDIYGSLKVHAPRMRISTCVRFSDSVSKLISRGFTTHLPDSVGPGRFQRWRDWQQEDDTAHPLDGKKPVAMIGYPDTPENARISQAWTDVLKEIARSKPKDLSRAEIDELVSKIREFDLPPDYDAERLIRLVRLLSGGNPL